jgi:hypothetical protein
MELVNSVWGSSKLEWVNSVGVHPDWSWLTQFGVHPDWSWLTQFGVHPDWSGLTQFGVHDPDCSWLTRLEFIQNGIITDLVSHIFFRVFSL